MPNRTVNVIGGTSCDDSAEGIVLLGHRAGVATKTTGKDSVICDVITWSCRTDALTSRRAGPVPSHHLDGPQM